MFEFEIRNLCQYTSTSRIACRHAPSLALQNSLKIRSKWGTNIMAYSTVLKLSFVFRSYVANRVTDKLTKVTDYIYCCRSGSAADTQAVADIVNYHLNFHK